MIRTSQNSLIISSCALATLLVPAVFATPVSADTVTRGGTVTVTPGGKSVQSGLRTAVVSASATNGDVEVAQAAMLAANVALGRSRTLSAIPSKDVAGAFGSLQLRDELDTKDYQTIGKRLKAARILTVTVTPGDMSDTSAVYSAVAELFDGTTGGMVGRGQATYTATSDAVNADTQAQTTAPANSGPMDQALTNRALSGAVYQAIVELSKPATFTGIVVSIPGPYAARLSLGSRSGLRNGARIEYLQDGAAVAYGTVIDVGAGESVATVAPEANVNAVAINTIFQTISNPTAERAGKTAIQLAEADYKSFERDFGLSTAVAGIVYYALIR